MTRRAVVGAVVILLLAAVTVVGSGASTSAPRAVAIENGLSRTPAMGFNNWNATHCRAEFNEQMVHQIADIFVTRGLKDAGYTYVNLDDCWALPNRDGAGNLVPDPVRFPNGIKAVADYVHGKGLKFGIYTSAGTKTCNELGFPGAIGHEQQDANLFASAGTTQVSALPAALSASAWGPVELDRSNGEQAAGDGRTLTINGVTYARGLGVHARSEVRYYLGGRCTSFQAWVGVDDEIGTEGSVSLEVWANGTMLAGSGVMRGTDAAKRVTANVSGLQYVHLAVLPTVDGPRFDHADWADATITCA